MSWRIGRWLFRSANTRNAERGSVHDGDSRDGDFPGIGTKFSLDTRRDENVCVVVHTDGMREIYHLVDDDDDEPYRIALTDEEARQVGALLGGVIYRPQLVQDLEVALGDLVVE